MPVKPAYQGEAQLVRWAESAAAGRTVTLRIDEDDVQHAFKGLKCGDQGQRLHVVVMLVDDNEELQDPETAKKRGHKAPTKPKPAEPLPSGAPAPPTNNAGEKSGDVGKSETPQGVVGTQMPRAGSIPASRSPAPELSEPVADKARTPFRELPRSQQAALKSRDQDFETWLIERYWRGQTEPHDVDALLKDTLAVSSKRTLDLDHTAAARWDALLTDFDNRGYVR